MDISHMQFFKLLIGTCLLSITFGCSTLKYNKVKMLKNEGFESSAEGWLFGLSDPLLFKFDEAEISDTSRLQITKLALSLKSYHLTQLKVLGYTDSTGDSEYNLKLSKQRADAVADIFLMHGFMSKNIEVIGKGAKYPISPNNSTQNRANNRRVAIVVNP